MAKRIYVCGNPLVPEDSLPLRILPALRRKHRSIDFIEFDPTEDIPRVRELVIIDTVINAKDVMLLDDIDSFVQTKALSLHDFDLGLNLKLAKKMGWLKNVRIIGVPPRMPDNQAIENVSAVIAMIS